jgi:hypothetical protein
MYHKLTMLPANLLDRLRERFSALMESVDPLIQAGRNLRQALDHRDPLAIARAIMSRYPCCYLINADFPGFPHIDFSEYRSIEPRGGVPLVRVLDRDASGLIPDRRVLDRFRVFGAALVSDNDVRLLPSAATIVEDLAKTGWHIMTVDDANCILMGRDIRGPQGGCLAYGHTWMTMVENAADRIGIAESLFTICERIVATRTAAMVVFTPGLPKSFRLWRLSLDGAMPPLPPV